MLIASPWMLESQLPVTIEQPLGQCAASEFEQVPVEGQQHWPVVQHTLLVTQQAPTVPPGPAPWQLVELAQH